MTDPPRLLDGILSYQERSLLESARAERPDEVTANKMLAPLGLGMAHVVSSAPGFDEGAASLKSAMGQATHQAALSSGTGAGANASIPPAASWLLGSSVKWLSALVLVGGLGAAAAWKVSQTQVSTDSQEPAPAQGAERPPAHTPDATAPSPGRELDLQAQEVQAPRVEPIPLTDSSEASTEIVAQADTKPASSGRPGKAQRSAGSQPGSPSNVTGEIALLDEVRLRIRDGQPKAALSLLGRYDQRFPHGSLKPEAQVLEVRARELDGEIRQGRGSPAL